MTDDDRIEMENKLTVLLEQREAIKKKIEEKSNLVLPDGNTGQDLKPRFYRRNTGELVGLKIQLAELNLEISNLEKVKRSRRSKKNGPQE